MLQFVNDVICTHTPPCQWLTSHIVCIPKKGGSSAIENQREISLMCAAMKLCNSHSKPLVLQPRRHASQHTNNFCPLHNTVKQITALQICIDSCQTRKKPLVILLLDFSKAFNCVHRQALHHISKFYCRDATNVDVMCLYTDTSARVQTLTGITEPFRTTSDVLQGNTLTPY